jgi:hypothetical protein
MGANAEEELNDIINQLDKLQKEIETTEPKEKSPQRPELKVVSSTAILVGGEQENISDELSDFRSNSSDSASLEDTLSQLEQEEPAKDSLLAQVANAAEEMPAEESDFGEELDQSVHHFDEVVNEASDEVAEENLDQEVDKEIMANKDTVPGVVTMTLSGDMTLKLRYEFEGQEVSVGFEDHCLKVQLTDGTEFKIPVSRKGKTLKNVA